MSTGDYTRERLSWNSCDPSSQNRQRASDSCLERGCQRVSIDVRALMGRMKVNTSKIHNLMIVWCCQWQTNRSSSSRLIKRSRAACITSAINFDANIRVEGATAARRSPRVRDSQHYFNPVCPLASKTFQRIKLTMASIVLTLACSLILLPLCHGAACFRSSGVHTNIPASMHVFVSTLTCVCIHGVL